MPGGRKDFFRGKYLEHVDSARLAFTPRRIMRFLAYLAAAIAALWVLRAARSPLGRRIAEWEKTRPAKQEWENYLTVEGEHAEALKRATGLDLAGFTHRIDSDSARHALHRHGKDKNRVTPGELARLAHYVRHAQKITLGQKKTGQKLQAITYQYTDARGEIFVVEEVRTGHKRLAFLTMYRK